MSEERFQLGDYWLSKRPNSEQWCRTWYDAKNRQTRRASLRTKDVREARNKLSEWFISHRELKNERPDDILIEELLIHDYKNHASKLRSAGAAKYCFRWASEFFAEKYISEITKEAQQDFVSFLRKQGKSTGYIRRILADLQAALSRSEMVNVPRIHLSLAPEGKPRQRILTVGEAAKLYREMDADHAKVFFLLSLATMGRPEAITNRTQYFC